MGHSDGFSQLQPALSEAEAEQLRVWGDMSACLAGGPAVDEDSEAAADVGVEAALEVLPVQIADDAQPVPPAGESAGAPEELFKRIGHLTRTLHDALHALGYQESLTDARDNLPDARDRLEYIARLTGDAAEKVLNSVDNARNLQDTMAERSLALRKRWAAVSAYAAKGERTTPAGAALIDETSAFLATLDEQASQTNAILTEIMMAQDFHDLTGQVIRKVVTLATTLEEQLVRILIDATPGEQRKKIAAPVLDGPVVNPEKRTDVVADQAGVDDLLASLGF